MDHHYGNASGFSAYSDLAVVSADDAWALGNDFAGTSEVPVAEHWNGKGWTSSAMPAGVTGTIAASVVLSSKDIWAVTDEGGYIVRRHGRHRDIAVEHLGHRRRQAPG